MNNNTKSRFKRLTKADRKAFTSIPCKSTKAKVGAPNRKG